MFKAKPIFEGLTAEEYSDVLGLCVSWYEFETKLFEGADKDDRIKSAYYNIVNLDCFDLESIQRVFKVTTESRTLRRLESIFQTIKVRLGDKIIRLWTDSYIESNTAYDKEYTSTAIKQHPYIILIPILTLIFMKDQSKRTSMF